MHLNVKSQRIAMRDKKAFLGEQYKKIKEKNRMGKTRDLFKKIKDIKRILHTRMGMIKDRNGKEQKQKKLRSDKNTQKNYTKKFLMPR